VVQAREIRSVAELGGDLADAGFDQIIAELMSPVPRDRDAPQSCKPGKFTGERKLELRRIFHPTKNDASSSRRSPGDLHARSGGDLM
jgi:hypothetical protein